MPLSGPAYYALRIFKIWFIIIGGRMSFSHRPKLLTIKGPNSKYFPFKEATPKTVSVAFLASSSTVCILMHGYLPLTMEEIFRLTFKVFVGAISIGSFTSLCDFFCVYICWPNSAEIIELFNIRGTCNKVRNTVVSGHHI